MSGCWPTDRMIVSASTRFSLPGTNVGLNRPFASKTDATSSVSSATTWPSRPRIALGPRPGASAMPSSSASRTSSGCAGICPRDSSETSSTWRAPRRSAVRAASMNALSYPHACSRLLGATGQRAQVLRGRVAQRRPGHVDRHVPAPDDDHPLAERHAVPQVGVQQELDAVDHAVEILARDVQVAALAWRRARGTPPQSRRGAGRRR